MSNWPTTTAGKYCNMYNLIFCDDVWKNIMEIQFDENYEFTNTLDGYIKNNIKSQIKQCGINSNGWYIEFESVYGLMNFLGVFQQFRMLIRETKKFRKDVEDTKDAEGKR